MNTQCRFEFVCVDGVVMVLSTGCVESVAVSAHCQCWPLLLWWLIFADGSASIRYYYSKSSLC